MEFRVLGPVEVRAGDGRVLTPARRQERCLLGILVLNAGRSVPAARLCELLWENDPPAGAVRSVRSYVSRVRALLADAGAGHDGVALLADHGGYLLKVASDAVDALRFRDLVDRAARTGDLAERDALLREALALWRGPALAGAASDRLRHRLAADLDELRQRAVEQSIATGLDLGRDGELLPDLARLDAEPPVRERVVELHMLALHRQGRTAEALDVYRRARTRLADELGLDPGPALVRLHTAILRGEPVPAVGAPPAGLRLTPAQLPADRPGFTGRHDHLRRLDELLAGDGTHATATVVASITGTAGVGKTALAVHWAQLVRDRFPDGQLCVDLRGHASGTPMRPIDALAAFLPALGVPTDQVPTDLDRAAGTYRSALAGKRVLVLLDNAHSAAQVRPLLPASPGCFVLVTSRERLGGLIAHDGAQRIALDVLDADEARGLLVGAVGGPRVAAEPDAATALCEVCAYLPLALRIVAAHLVDRPGRRIADLVDDLRAGNRLSALSVLGDERSAVRAAFDLSYAVLPADAQRLFRLLGLVPGADVTAPTAAALTGGPPEQAARLLDRLASAHLLTEHAPGRYTCHDLLRRYAADRTARDDAAADRDAAVTRLYAYYLRLVDEALARNRTQLIRLPATPLPDDPGWPGFAGAGEAMAWLDAERANLVAAVVSGSGPREATWILADALRGYFSLRVRMVDWLTVAGAALAAATAAGDRRAQAAAGLSLAHASVSQEHHGDASEYAARAHAHADAAGWAQGRSAALNLLGVIDLRTGRLARAAERFTLVLDASRRSGDGATLVRALINLGLTRYDAGDLPAALELAAEVTRLGRTAPTVQGDTLGGVLFGQVCLALGRHAEAREHLQRAVAAAREVADPWGECVGLCGLAQIERDTGDQNRALNLGRAALALVDRAGPGEHQAEALNAIGSAHRCLGRPAEAVDQHRRALDMARAAQVRRPELEALLGLAAAYTDLGQFEPARRYAGEALAGARESGYRLLERDARAAVPRPPRTAPTGGSSNRPRTPTAGCPTPRP